MAQFLPLWFLEQEITGIGVNKDWMCACNQYGFVRICCNFRRRTILLHVCTIMLLFFFIHCISKLMKHRQKTNILQFTLYSLWIFKSSLTWQFKTDEDLLMFKVCDSEIMMLCTSKFLKYRVVNCYSPFSQL